MRKVQLILLKESLPVSTKKESIYWGIGILKAYDNILKLYYLPAIKKFLETPTFLNSLLGEREEFWRFPITRWERLKYWFRSFSCI